MTLRIKFWGVRGSIACASLDHMKYGGNTSCIEVQAGDHTFVMDAGTGIRNFSKVILERDIRHTHLLCHALRSIIARFVPVHRMTANLFQGSEFEPIGWLFWISFEIHPTQIREQ